MLRTIRANIMRRKLRLLATALAVLLGVAFTSGTLVLTDTLGATFNNLFGDIYAGSSAVVRSSHTVKGSLEGFGGGTTRANVDQAVIPAIRSTPGVRAVSGDIFGYAQIIGKDGKAVGNPRRGAPTIGGNWIADPALSGYHLDAGRGPTTAGEVVIDRGSAKKTGYKLGDRFPVLTQKGTVTVTLVGISKFGKSDSAAGSTQVDFTAAQAQQYVGEVGKFSEIRVAADPGITQQEMVSRLRKVMPPGDEAVTARSVAKALEDQVKQGVGFFATFLLIFALVGLLVGAFIIVNTFSILVAQRTRELALLRALGASRRQVMASVVAEAAVIGTIGAAVGLLFGTGLAGAMLKLFASDTNTPAVVAPTTVLAAFVVGIGITVLSAVFPARRASRIAPVAAMRDTEAEARPGRPVRPIVGGLFLLAGVAFAVVGATSHEVKLVGVAAACALIGAVVFGPVIATTLGQIIGAPLRRLRGMPAQLGQENVLRNPRRTASTASALMIGVFLVSGIAVFAASALASINKLIDDNFKGDFVVESTGNGLPASLQQSLSADPRLGPSTGLTYVQVQAGKRGMIVLGTDPAVLVKLYNMQVKQGDLATIGDAGLGISDSVASNHHWKLGSAVTLRYLDGRDHHFTIKAIYKHQPFQMPVIATNAGIAGALPNAPVQVIFVANKAGQSDAATRAVLEEHVTGNPTAKVNSNQQFKDETAAQMNSLLKIIYALLAFAVFIAVFGVVNTLGLSILERTREIGLLRAVGMARSQLRTSIRVESILIALTGAVMGMVLGVGLGAAVMKAISKSANLTALAIPVGTLVVVLVAGVVVGLGAAILPAWRAARLDPLRALSVE